MNDLRFAFRQLVKNPSFRSVRASACARQQGPATTASRLSRFGLACLGIYQTDSRNLSGVNQVPMYAHPNHEEFGSRLRRDGEIIGMSNPQCPAVGDVQLESAKRSAVTHSLEVRDFHVLDPILNRFIGIIN